MSRVTTKMIDGTLVYVNKRLARAGSSARVVRQGRYGYQALDLYDDEGRCLRTLTTGTTSDVKRFADGLAWTFDLLDVPYVVEQASH